MVEKGQREREMRNHPPPTFYHEFLDLPLNGVNTNSVPVSRKKTLAGRARKWR